MAWNSPEEFLAKETRGALLRINRQGDAETAARWLTATADETILHSKLPVFRPLPFQDGAWETVLLEDVFDEASDPYPLLQEALRVSKSRLLIIQWLGEKWNFTRLRQIAARLTPVFAGKELLLSGIPTACLVIPREQTDRESFPQRADYLPLRFVLKIGVPSRTVEGYWGDVHYAEGLQRALQATGYSCSIQYLSEWEEAEEEFDVVVHIKGLSRYNLKSCHLNLMWMINHPELHTDDELNGYDGIMVASHSYAELLAYRLHRPVVFAPQAVDAEWFAKAARPGEPENDFDVIFIGNNHARGKGEIRPGVAALLKAWEAQGRRWKIGVWGKFWEGRLPQGWLQGEAVAPEKAAQLYRAAKIVLNDHQPDMRAYGFVNERTFIIGASGGFQISDHVKGIELEPVIYFATPEDLGRLINYYLSQPEERKKKAQELRKRAFQDYSFDQSVQILRGLLDDIRAFPRPPLAEATLGAGTLQLKEELEKLRATCKEQWEALQRIRSSFAYRLFRGIKSLSGKRGEK